MKHKSELPEFYKPFDSDDFVFERCFLCGEDLTEVNRSDEHVFPKWLLHRFNLWNNTLTMLNGSKYQYKRLVIPCCKQCNNVHLSAMENHFLSLFERNFANLNSDDEQVVFQWTSKILYGTLYKELSLKMDVRNPDLGSLLKPEQVARYSSMHLHLQSIRIPTDFREPKPWSIFVFNYKEDTYDYINEVQRLCVSIKLGKIGITIVFQDNNEVEKFCAPVKGLRAFKLNDLQFVEVTAIIFYGKYIAINTPSYITMYLEERKQMQVVSIGGIRSRPWDDQEYAVLLEAMLAANGIVLDSPIYVGPKQLHTSLVDDDGVLMMHKLNSARLD